MSHCFVSISPMGHSTTIKLSSCPLPPSGPEASPPPSNRGTGWNAVRLTAHDRVNKKAKEYGEGAKTLEIVQGCCSPLAEGLDTGAQDELNG